MPMTRPRLALLPSLLLLPAFLGGAASAQQQARVDTTSTLALSFDAARQRMV